jgi:iron complex transport system ATP-binding protein
MRHQSAVFRLLRSVADAGRAVVVVTHDVNLAAQACDRLAFLRAEPGGAMLAAAGPPAEVVTAAVLHAAYGIEVEIEKDTSGLPVVRRRL